MSFSELKDEILRLPEEERQNISALLTALRMAENPNHRSEPAKKIEDKNSSHWVDLEELKIRSAAR